MENDGDIVLSEVFSKEAGSANTATLSVAQSEEIVQLAYASAAYKRMNERAFEKFADDEQKKRDKKDADDDFVQMATDVIRQAYEEFQTAYADTMAFYDDAQHRLNNLEARIKDRVQELDSRTGLLSGAGGEPVFMDEEDNFYRIEAGQRRLITDEEELASLREQKKAIEAAGRTVRSEQEQDDYLELMTMLTDTADLEGDIANRRDEVDRLNEEVENDHGKAPEATETMRIGREDTESRLGGLESKFEALEARRSRFDQNQNRDQAPETSTVDSDFTDMSATAPPPTLPGG